MTPQRELEAGRVVAGKYRIDGKLGEGGMGAVYAATHVVTDKAVALKRISPDAHETSRERLLREAKAAGRVDHPNVVDVYDVGEDEDGAIFLVMERLQGLPLENAMQLGPMEVAEAVGLLMPVMRGVAAAHRQGVIHRDLKPENIFLVEHQDGSPRTVKVLDFGISKMTGVELQLTQTGMVLGTPYYMAPEQLRGDTDIDERCDQYALGCILYEMLEGRPPYDAGSLPELVAKKLAEGPQPFRQPVPRELRRLVLRAMHQKPAKRFPDVRTFALELEAHGRGARFHDTATDWSGAYPRSAPPSQDTTIRTPASARRRWWAAALVVAIAVIGLAGWLWRNGPETEAIAEERDLPPLAESTAQRTADSDRESAGSESAGSESAGSEPSAAAEPSATAEPEIGPAERATPSRRVPAQRRESAETRSGSLTIDDF